MEEDPRVFISYARSDGEAFAAELRERLEQEEPEITLWQDRARMEGGKDWWNQILEALDHVQFMVLVMTPAAQRSPVVRKEWRAARERGVCIYPVVASPDLDFAALPRWMSKAHFYHLDREWETFVNYLKSPCRALRVPFMADDLPEGYVDRPQIRAALRAAMLDGEDPAPGTVVLHGPGGFGKTTQARALCYDDEVLTAYDGGVLWATLGERPNVLNELIKVYAALTGERPPFVDVEDAAAHLAARLGESNCLLVIDDVWNEAHLRPFLRGGSGCARLITTRRFEVAAQAGQPIEVYEMTAGEAVDMLTARLDPLPPDREPFRQLARRLGEWPLMLELAGAALRQRVLRGSTPAGAIEHLNRALDRRGATAFDRTDAVARNQAIARSLDVSLDQLEPVERGRCIELAILPEDVDVPLSTLQALWGLDDFDAEETVERLSELSLLRYDLNTATIRLHAVIRAYLAVELSDQAAVHARLIAAWGDPHRLPDAYAWRWLAYHLGGAGRLDELRPLLLDGACRGPSWSAATPTPCCPITTASPAMPCCSGWGVRCARPRTC